jgi:diguanylate cyclase (GGDEF)-like protein/PAS domain S-box-containing protein
MFRLRFGGTVQLQDMVSQDPKMLEVFRQIEQAAAAAGTVLITGETGTGKELVARAIHGMGPRSLKPFVEVHCAAYSEGLIESELFGHTKGAFTGALQERKGKIRTAGGGTLFLDEISSISMNVQTKLLRVLQEKRVEPVGSDLAVPVDIRVIAACNEELEPLIKEGKFRADLYYRLNVLHIHLPPLRHRRGDIPLLVNHFINKKTGDKPIRVSSDLMGVLIRHPWYGNIRELENCVEAMVAKCDGPIFLPKHLPFIPAGPWETRLHFGASLDQLMSAFEKFLLIDALKAARGRIGTTGKMLGITERTLERKLSKYELQKDSFKGATIGNLPEPLPHETEEAESPFRMLVKYHPDPFLWVDRDLKILAMSPASKSLSGFDDKEIIGKKHCFDFLKCRPEESDDVQCNPQQPYCLEAVKGQKSASGAKIRLEGIDGNEKWVQTSIVPLPLALTGTAHTSVIVLRDITALKQTEKELRKQAVTDGLTGLYNRRYFEESLRLELKRSERYTRPLSLLLCDVDSFKQVNDRHGHPYGDTILQTIARLLQGTMRTSDLICRYGGEEFAILLPETGKAGAFVAAEKVRKVLEAAHIRAGESSLNLTLSIGVASYPEDAKDGGDLVLRADEALYRAKKNGKNCVA